MKTTESQNSQIRNWLLAGRSITSLEELDRFRCFRLASRISDLKQQGLPIERQMISNGESRFAMYYLSQEFLSFYAKITTK